MELSHEEEIIIQMAQTFANKVSNEMPLEVILCSTIELCLSIGVHHPEYALAILEVTDADQSTARDADAIIRILPIVREANHA